MNKLTAASLKLHMFGVFVLQTLLDEGKLSEGFDPMSLDTSIVSKFDPNEMKNQFKTNKKTKTNVKVVSSPRENVVNVIATNHYESNQTDDVVMQIVNAAKSDVAEKPKRKPRQKKAPVESDVSETLETSVSETTEPVVADKPKKKSPPKKKAAPAEPVVSVDVETTESAVAVETTEPVVVEEKPKKKSPPKKKAAPAEVVVAVVDATTEPVVAVADATAEPVVAVEEKPKKKSPPKKKTVPVEPIVAVAEAVVVETTVANSSKKTDAIKAVNDLVSSVILEEEEIVEPIVENKVEDTKEEEPKEEPKNDNCNDSGAHEDEDDDEDEEEIQARIMNYEGKQYLIDGDNNIYDKESFDELGTFNADTQKIIFN